ncbi:MAG: hypothetical protein QXW98_04700 [Candidatus Caldarchaeum sp.]
MVRSNPQTAVAKYQDGVRTGAQRYVENAIRFGVPKLNQWFTAFFAAHQAAAYVPAPATDADRHRNVQTAWDTTRAVRAQYRGRVGAVAGAVPVVV